MPVSRKRKKKAGKSGRPRQPARVDQRGTAADPIERDRDELATALQGLVAFRDQVDTGRKTRAADVATNLVTELTAVVANQPDVITEDVLCQRLGTVLSEASQSPPDNRVEPGHLAQALVTAAAAAVEATLGEADAWRAPWRVLTAVAGILPYPDSEAAADAIKRLRNSRRELPTVPPGPSVSGPVRWTRDRYGSRFAVTAPIVAADQPARWYLWDIDACGHQAITVHSGYYATPEEALTAWQDGVGPIAATGTELATVDDPRLSAQLLPIEEEIRFGGENEEQFAEYHRGRRLAQVVKQTLRQQKTRPGHGMDAATAAVEFAKWLRANDTSQPEDLDELAEELADSWSLNDIDAVFATCSPHRVALFMQHVPGYYEEDFADQLVALLPDWIRWLAARDATPPELADRCLPYAEGKPHPQLMVAGRHEPNYLARVIE